MRCVIYVLYGTDTFTAGKGNSDRSGCAKNCCIIQQSVQQHRVMCRPGLGVDDFTLYNCDMFKQQYHQHLLVYQEMLVIHKHNIKHTLLSHNSVCLILCL